MNIFLLSSLIQTAGSGTLLLSVLLTLTSPMIYAGWKSKERFDRLSSIPDGIEEASVGDQVSVSGNVGRSSTKTESPFQSKNCELAMWDICRLKRRGTLGAGFVWSQEAIGMRDDRVVIETGDDSVRVHNLSCQEVLDSSEKIKRSLMADSTTKFSSIEIELENCEFEERFEPINEPPAKYDELTDELTFEKPSRNSYDSIERAFRKLRTPSNTTRYRESVFQKGDRISVIGKKTKNGLSFESSESTNPLISSRPVSDIKRKYRRAYIFQLYSIPILCVVFSAVMTYGSYI